MSSRSVLHVLNKEKSRITKVGKTNVQVRQVADEHDMVVHLDGARLMNASVASGVPMKDFVAQCHSVSLCLSKVRFPFLNVSAIG